jgi:hypothetical protein
MTGARTAREQRCANETDPQANEARDFRAVVARMQRVVARLGKDRHRDRTQHDGDRKPEQRF